MVVKVIETPYALMAVLMTLLAFCLAASSWYKHLLFRSSDNIPVLGDSSGSWLSRCAAHIRWTTHGVQMIKESYRSNPDAVYRVPTFQEFYIIPAKYIYLYKEAPRTALSLTEAIKWYFLRSYTGRQDRLSSRTVWAAVRKLNANLPSLIPQLHRLTDRTLSSYYPATDDWTEITPWPVILRLVTTANTSIFIGEKFCNNETWLQATEQYASNVAVGASLLKLVPDMLRPALALMLPQLYRIRRIRQVLRDTIVQELEHRQQNRKEKQLTTNEEASADMLEMFEQVSQSDENHPDQIAERVLSLSLTGTHGPSSHAMNVLLDLAAKWDEYTVELRAELDEVIAASNGEINQKHLDRLEKLDSFMKESLRLEPTTALSFFRRAMEPLQLPTGETIPALSLVSVPAIPTGISGGCCSDRPEEFDGWRFYRERKVQEDPGCPCPTSTQDFLWTTPSIDYLGFGYGRYACPGRFYAGAQTKLIVACILLKYDLRLLAGEDRPPNLTYGDAIFPNPKAKILYRSRQ